MCAHDSRKELMHAYWPHPGRGRAQSDLSDGSDLIIFDDTDLVEHILHLQVAHSLLPAHFSVHKLRQQLSRLVLALVDAVLKRLPQSILEALLL